MKSAKLPIFIGLVFALCVLIAFVPYLKKDEFPPALYHFTLPNSINRSTVLSFSLYSEAGINPKEVEIRAIQGNVRELLAPSINVLESGSAKLLGIQLALLGSTKLNDGDIELEIKARSTGYLKRFGGLISPFWTINRIKFNADITPPEISFSLLPTAFSQGGSNLILLNTNEALRSLRVEATGYSYTVLKLAPARYAALVAFSQVPQSEYQMKITATDAAGNANITDVSVALEQVNFRDDQIKLSNKFLQNKFAEFKEISGKYGKLKAIDLKDNNQINATQKNSIALELFLHMNNTVRISSYNFIKNLCQTNSLPEKLWNGAFLEMPKATRRSEFADKRSYLHNGTVIDQQVHLGLDYASVARDFIPAANNGKVAYAGLIGIHGKAVLIDHGLGLFSLYSHLSSIDVQNGQLVARGAIIGRTGSSGMAGGDHLHFEILVNGISVSPNQWFDADWVRLNIEEPLAAFAGE